ncbi:hypothetical protein ACSS6W_000713 [Trichoderma asperelloides]
MRNVLRTRYITSSDIMTGAWLLLCRELPTFPEGIKSRRRLGGTMKSGDNKLVLVEANDNKTLTL